VLQLIFFLHMFSCPVVSMPFPVPYVSMDSYCSWCSPVYCFRIVLLTCSIQFAPVSRIVSPRHMFEDLMWPRLRTVDYWVPFLAYHAAFEGRIPVPLSDVLSPPCPSPLVLPSLYFSGWNALRAGVVCWVRLPSPRFPFFVPHTLVSLFGGF